MSTRRFDQAAAAAARCAGERLKQEQRLLNIAEEQKLEQPADQTFSVLYSLIAETPTAPTL